MTFLNKFKNARVKVKSLLVWILFTNVTLSYMSHIIGIRNCKLSIGK